jgi:hypothetical protein
MSNYDDEPTFDEDETPPEEEGSNRTFLIAAGVLGSLVLLGLLCSGGYLFFTRNTTQQAEATAFVQATNQQATIQVGLTQKAIEAAAAQALTQAAAPTNTLPPTNTPVIAQATFTPVGAALNPADAATIAAGLTQIASSQNNAAATAAAGLTQLASSTRDPVLVGTIAANLTQGASIQTNEAATITVGLTQLASAQNPATATIAAGFTQLALSTQTVIATSTALPNTGFADDIGAPGLLLMALALVVVIFLVRRLRASPTK